MSRLALVVCDPCCAPIASCAVLRSSCMSRRFRDTRYRNTQTAFTSRSHAIIYTSRTSRISSINRQHPSHTPRPIPTASHPRTLIIHPPRPPTHPIPSAPRRAASPVTPACRRCLPGPRGSPSAPGAAPPESAPATCSAMSQRRRPSKRDAVTPSSEQSLSACFGSEARFSLAAAATCSWYASAGASCHHSPPLAIGER